MKILHDIRLHIIRTFLLLLMFVSSAIVNDVWAATVTYHILTLPIDPSRYDYHMKSEVTGHRLEAFKVVVNDQTTVELPAHYKSPLATGFTYYKPDDITKSGSAISLYDGVSSRKGILYKVNGEDTPADATDDPTPVGEGTAITTSTAEYYVVYTYNESNTIAKLDGSVNYNIGVKGKGFLSLNRGRNNRPAVIPTAKVDPEMLASPDFSYVESPGNGIATFWDNGKNKREDIESKFFFGFKFEGNDPYHIVVRTSYARDYTFIEKNEDGDKAFVYKWYKGAALMAKTTGNAYLASDDHIRYKTVYNSAIPNPTDLSSGYDSKTGYFHGNDQTWGTVALLNNTDGDGYVFMGSRTVDGSGNVPGPKDNTKYYYLTFNGYNNLNFGQITSADATKSHTVDGIYPLEKVTFKVATPFCNPESPSDAHIVSVEDLVSKYTVDNDPILTKYLPAALKRKYCNFNGNFYKDAACTQAITHFSQATKDPTEGYQVYVGYDVIPGAPKFLSPSADYTTATWYELTDEGSVQESGRKIKWNEGDLETPSAYKNNGANGTYEKESEFAFEGDPYELKVLYRKGTEDAESKTYVTLSTHNTWDMPSDETAGSFLLRKYKGTGYWNWNAGNVSADVAYGSSSTPSTDKNAQTITINLSGLDASKYYKITTSGAGAGQIVSVTPSANNVQKVTGTAMTVVVNLAENTSGENKEMTVTFQEYDDAEGNTTFGSASDITITQGTASSAFGGNVVDYHATNSTRVKVLDLPTRTFTYNIVDKSGRIAVKASAKQTIFSALSLASIPSIIVSPFLVGETVTFYSTFDSGSGAGTGTSRTHLSGAITETPGAAANIYVKYTTSDLDAKPFKLSEDQEIFVRLNGQYIYYDSSDGSIKSSADYVNDDRYKWKLRNRDPYDMLIDNMAARTKLSVADQSETVTVYDDSGTGTSQSRQKGAWLKLDSDLPTTSEGTALTFNEDRTQAEHFIAKSSSAKGVYEVMVATGSSIDAITTYYNIGRPADKTVKIYNNAAYTFGKPELAFNLEQSAEYTYYLIDKAKHNLLTVKSKSPELVLPAEYQSPLVGTYNYYGEENITITGDIYEPTNASVKIDNLDAVYTKTSATSEQWTAADETHKLTATDETNLDTQAKALKATGDYYFRIGETSTYYHVNVTKRCHDKVYVTYVANDVVNFGKGQYMLKFLEPYAAGYNLEDGLDKLTLTKIQAIYPYCNGDGNLNIYGNDMQKEQFNGGASTRPRWAWYFDSESKDPYHVTIRSKSTIKYKDVSHYTYLTTHVVHFNQDGEGVKKVVTGGTLPTIASINPTEYMVLGTKGNYRLMTTKEINDGTTNERRRVTSLEQYWKTYNMIKLDVLGISNTTDAYSDDETTWVVPDDKRDALETALNDKGVGTGKWHSYTAYANATRWNGYNDKTDGHEKKVVENIEHWYQTFDMGNGTFDIENAEIPPVLVLLDLHGWEIMRLPLPTVNYPEGDDELKALRAYDSPMVDKYYFYSNATKASGCHKYSLRLDDKGKERDQIKENGVHYTSTSLGDLPLITATGVKSGSAFNDQFVIYTVKEEYAKSYDYAYNESTQAETETPSKFLVLLRSRFFRYIDGASNPSYFSKPIYEASNPVGGNVYDAILDPQQSTVSQTSTSVDDDKDGKIDNINLWYLQPNQNIDKEMGIKYASTTGSTGEPWTELEYKKYYYDNGKAGFDPYNIQLKNAGNSKFVTSHLTSTTLDDGIMIGNYSGEGGTTNVTLEEGFSYADVDPMASTGSVGYDHTNIKMSNQTFMAVSDANGNLQLMPRFDHKKRVNLVNNSGDSFTTLQDPDNHPKASASDNASMGTQTVFLVRPQIFEYQIINNSGNESLRYKRSGDFYPTITDHFKSPLAKDFTYYKGLTEHGEVTTCTAQDWTDAELKRSVTTEALMNSQINLLPTSGTYYYQIGTRGVFTYKKVTVTKGLLEQQITGSFAAAGLGGDDCEVVVRYDYDAGTDHDADRLLEGKWFTAKLANMDLQASGTLVYAIGNTQGTGINLYAGEDKPATVDEDDKKWQWKFLAAPTDPSSDYYVEPDPYDIQLFNRQANHTTNPSEVPSPMGVGIKVPNADDGADHFALLSHSEGGYALAVAGIGNYTYKFVNGASMTTSVAATTKPEASFTQKAGVFDGVGSQLLVNNDVKHNFTYKVINNGGANYVVTYPGYLAVEATQDNEAAETHEFFPYLPEAAQTPLLRMKDYKYYGFATKDDKGNADPSDDTYSVIPQTILYTLYGLYDDVVYVRYNAYSMDSTEFKVPNMRNATDAGQVARHANSVDVAMNINHGLPYNIIWDTDHMMQSTDNLTVSDGNNHALSGNTEFVWYFTGNDPYGLKIQHKGGKYLNGTKTMVAEGSAPTFMLLKKTGYDYGILQLTGDDDILSGYGQATVTTNPTKYIIFGLSIHNLKYHLIIANTGNTVNIDFRETESDPLTTKTINGTTQRDLTSVNDGEGTHYPGEKYQLGRTFSWGNPAVAHTYSYDAGSVSIGDELVLPNIFYRPNCLFDFYIEGIYSGTTGSPITDLENKYKGLKRTRLMSDEALIDQDVVVNVVYRFDPGLETNAGGDFVTEMKAAGTHYLWYTFETADATPQLAHYTHVRGMRAETGRALHYTNDYLWSPLGDPYGFKSYNRYIYKNNNDYDKVLTSATLANNAAIVMDKPGDGEPVRCPSGNEIYELLPSGDIGTGTFRVHPLLNTDNTLFLRVKESENPTENGKLILSNATPVQEWTYGLSTELLNPYYQGAGNVGGLTTTAKEGQDKSGTARYEEALADEDVFRRIRTLQSICYNKDNIVDYAPGYYRLCNQLGASSLSPQRYASGYLHQLEVDVNGDEDESDAIPMHFYSKKGVTGSFAGDTNPLTSGYTETAATQGDIPIPATEYDPSTIFYFTGSATEAKMQTQGLYVQGDADNGYAKMTDTPVSATTFHVDDIGGAVVIIYNLDGSTRRYINYGQNASIYDLKYYENVDVDGSKWCMEPASTQNLKVATNNGGDGYYYSTFYAPFDVSLPADADGKTYNAYVCKNWDDAGLNPEPVPAVTISEKNYAEGKFVPAGIPVIIRVKDESGSVTLTLPTTSPTASSITTKLLGTYLEKLLPVDASHDVYTMGVPMTSHVEEDTDYNTTGEFVAPLPEFATSGVGFYINATPNKEADPKQASWQRNNRYVLHNKIYYRAEPEPSPARAATRGVEFVPVIFGDEEEEKLPGIQDENDYRGDGCVYDLMGRKVATRQQVIDGTWRNHLTSGIYIINGKKIIVK